MANPIFDKIDGAVIGANTNIVSDVNSEGKQTSTVIGGARVNLGNLLSANVNQSASLYTTNFIGPLSYQAFSFLKLRALS